MHRVSHYDGTTSEHGTIRAARNEAKKRLQPWREGNDRILFYSSDETTERAGIRDEFGEWSDPESTIRTDESSEPGPCVHESVSTADGYGAYCAHCGETTA